MKFQIQINAHNLKNDIFSGIIVALVSIPISMGYAQVAGLPSVYGLYGSLLPILVYGLFASSPQFVVGVDAMPAAMIGSSLAEFGILANSPEALKIIPAIAFLVGVWLLVFRFLQAGRVVKYISNPVMGGFISGVGLTIILMQLPKLFGGNAGTGEIIILIPHIVSQFQFFNLPSLVLGVGTVAIILVFKKLFPKFPMTVVMLAFGILITAIFKIDRFGVKLLPAVQKGLPKLSMPVLPSLQGHVLDFVVLSLSIALVIMAQTLLASNNYASKYDYALNNNRELVAYAMMNFAGSISGSCPINGSVSRSGIADQFGCKSQLMSIVSSITMLIVVLFCTPFFVYLPVPILTGIVMSALIGIIDFKQAVRLWKCNKTEFAIFITALLGVLFLGTLYGVVTGVILSFVSVVTKAVLPPRAYIGKIPGQHGYYNVNRNKSALPITNTVIYRFGGNLFFANIDTFQKDIEDAIKPDTKYVIVDAGGIGDIDITAADRLLTIANKLEKQNIRFFITEHQGHLNDQLRLFGAEKLIINGNVRRTMSLALRTCGFEKPYSLEGLDSQNNYEITESAEKQAEFEWAFGDEAEEMMEKMADQILDSISTTADSTAEEISHVDIEKLEEKLLWGKIGLFDEEELLEHLQIKLERLVAAEKMSKEHLDALKLLIEKRKKSVEEKLQNLNPKGFEALMRKMLQLEERLRNKKPK